MAAQTRLAVLLLAVTLSSCALPAIYGTYRDCAIACSEITLRPDGTFTYRFSGDIYGDSSVSGTWRFESGRRDLIAVEGPREREKAASVRYAASAHDAVAVRVVDDAGEPIPGARVLTQCGDSINGKITDVNGTAQLAPCAVTHLQVDFPDFRGFDGNVVPSSSYEVTLPVTLPGARVSSELWYISRGKLYRLSGQPLPKFFGNSKTPPPV
jgi:hypothetical protein